MNKHSRLPIVIASAAILAVVALPFLTRRSTPTRLVRPLPPVPTESVSPRTLPMGMGANWLNETASELETLASNGRIVANASTFQPRTAGELLESLGEDPEVLFRWVRDETWWVPYEGILRGPSGVLMDRTGSTLDRALLLADLLKSAGFATRMQYAELEEAEAAAVWERLIEFPPVREEGEEGVAEELVLDLAEHLDISSEKLQESVQQSRRTGETLREDSVSQMVTQLSVVARALEEERSESFEEFEPDPIQTLRHHYWVRARIDGKWVDCDPLDPSSSLGDSLAKGRRVKRNELEDKLHKLELRVVCEQWKRDRRSEHVPLSIELTPSRGLAGYLRLSYEEGTDEQSWRAVIALNGERYVGEWMRADEKQELTALWLEAELRGPDARAPMRRAIFDWLGPAARASADKTPESTADREEERALALSGSYDLLPLTSWMTADAVVHDCLDSLIAEACPLADDLRVLAQGYGRGSSRPTFVPLYTLALMRQQWARYTEDTYVSGIHLLGLERRPVPGPAGDLAWQELSEVWCAPIGVLPGSETSPIQARIERGLADATTASVLLSPLGEGPGALFTRDRRGEGWTWIQTAEDPAWNEVEVPADLDWWIRAEQFQGRITFVPREALNHEGRPLAGFWSVAPNTGDLRWIDDRGRRGLPHICELETGAGDLIGQRLVRDLMHTGLATHLVGNGRLGFLFHGTAASELEARFSQD